MATVQVSHQGKSIHRTLHLLPYMDKDFTHIADPIFETFRKKKKANKKKIAGQYGRGRDK